MNRSRPTHRWPSRRWYDPPLALLGFGLLLMGGSFFALVAWVGAPVMPYTGLVVAALGLWIGFIRPLRNASTTESVRELEHDH